MKQKFSFLSLSLFLIKQNMKKATDNIPTRNTNQNDATIKEIRKCGYCEFEYKMDDETQREGDIHEHTHKHVSVDEKWTD